MIETYEREKRESARKALLCALWRARLALDSLIVRAEFEESPRLSNDEARCRNPPPSADATRSDSAPMASTFCVRFCVVRRETDRNTRGIASQREVFADAKGRAIAASASSRILSWLWPRLISACSNYSLKRQRGTKCSPTKDRKHLRKSDNVSYLQRRISFSKRLSNFVRLKIRTSKR